MVKVKVFVVNPDLKKFEAEYLSVQLVDKSDN